MLTDLLSVVIPCKNEEKYIRRTLNGLIMQSIITAQTPIYIADANSTDKTLSIIEEFKSELNITVVEGGLPAVGRNNGAKHCNTKYILFLDADIILGERWTLERALDTAEDRKLDLVTTYIRSTETAWHDNILWKLHSLASRTKVLGSYATGMFIFIKTETFWKNGGFDEEIALGEDWDLTHRIPSTKFAICDTYILTSSRRFTSNGYLKTFWQYVMVACSKSYRKKKNTDYFDVQYT